MRCGRTVETLEEMDSGCACGSKVFVYTKGNINDGETLRAGTPKEAGPPAARFAFGKSAANRSDLPEARAVTVPAASKQPHIVVLDIENVRMLEKGVFEVDLGALLTKPLVLKDDEEVYHVRLPLAKDSGEPKKTGAEEDEDAVA
jgi:predicted  nucleic acid-binding Zn-ribbon protein